jgi:hypothetical protein
MSAGEVPSILTYFYPPYMQPFTTHNSVPELYGGWA